MNASRRDILARFDAVLLDMNGTFMFGEDRFGPDQDYSAAYRAAGGRRLAADLVQGTVAACCDTLERIYSDPERFDSFPQVLDTLRAFSPEGDLPETELKLLERVIAQHEVGYVPEPYALALRRLARTHRLGVVTNIWSRKELYLQELTRAGVLDLFVVAVFSSDISSIKPSRKPFDEAVRKLGVPSSDVVFVGDSLRCDVGGAARAGLTTVWIDAVGGGRRLGDPQPDFVVGNLLELLHT